MKKIAAIIMAGCFGIGFGLAAETSYDVIPLPQEIINGNGEFALGRDVRIIYPEGNEAMKRNAEYLSEYLKKATGNDYGIGTDGGVRGNILLQVVADDEAPESYQLKVDCNGIVISGGSEAGVFYGIQTLRKSIPVAENSVPVLEAVEINDVPRFGYRGVHFDVCRHFFTVDEVKRFIDMMALHNMNRLHWHISDDQGWRIEIKKYPLLTEIGSKREETVIGHNSGNYDNTPYGGFYTREEAREIVDYAAERYITVIPEIDLPGHMQAALAAYPELGCTGGPYDVWTMWGVSDDVLCAGNDKVLTFIDDVLAEIIDIFPSEYVHIGGDECPKVRWEACPKCQTRIRELGFKTDEKHTKEEYLQSYIITHGVDFLAKHGRKMIGWDEILEGGLAPDATVMAWRGEGGGIEAARKDHDVIMVPNNYFYFDYYQSDDIENEPLSIGGYVPLDLVYSYEPAKGALTPEEQKHILGIQANHWTEYICSFPHLQYMALPRWAALCEVQWTDPGKKNYENFKKRLLQLINTYKSEGYNYARHLFDVSADFNVNPEAGVIEVALKTADDAPIHYTLDGTAPDASSRVYDSPLKIDGNCNVKAVVARPEGMSRTLSEKIAFSKSTCKPIVANKPVNKRYEFGGVSTLVDGLKGNGNYKTGRWIGFYCNDMDVTVDLQEPLEISSVDFSACVEKGDWIFDVRGITVEVSDDNRTFRKVFSEEYPEMKESDRNGLYDHHVTFAPVKARYVRITAPTEENIPAWHGGTGNPGFLFVDEISIN